MRTYYRSSLLLVLLVVPASSGAKAPRPGAKEWLAASRLPETVETPLPSDPLQVTVHRLSNGLTVYLSPNSQEPKIEAWIAVRAGSRHDPDDSTGMAHYLEHMLFKGTHKLGTVGYLREKRHLDHIRELYEKLFATREPGARNAIYAEIDRENQKALKYAVPQEMEKAYKRLGFSGMNAFTSQERTVFVVTFPKNRLEAWATVEADRFPNAVFRLFQSEIEAVYEEKNLYLDDPEQMLYRSVEKELWGDHPLGHEIEGSIEHLKNPSLAKMYAFHDRFYVPNDMAIVLAGDFDRKETLELLEKHFGTWKVAPPPAPDPRVPAALTQLRKAELRFEAEEKAILAWRVPAFADPDADALTVMDMVFSNTRAGVADLSLVQAQKVKSAGSEIEFHNEGGAWDIWVSPKEGQTLEQARDLLLEAVEKVKKGEFSEEDLRANVLNYEIEQKRKLETNGARVAEMAEAFAHYEEWPRAAGRLERLRAVTKADVVRVAGKYLGAAHVEVLRRKGKPEILSIAKPQFTKVTMDPDRASDFFKEITAMPADPIEPRWLENGRDYQETPAGWGRLYSVRNPVNDLFELDLRFERGRRQERELCAAIELANVSGAGPLSADEFKKALYRLGTALSAGCSERDSSIHMTGLDANLEKSVELMRRHFREPRIEPGALDRLIQVQLGAHKDNKLNPETVLEALAEYARYGKDSETLNELSDAEVKALKEDKLAALMRDVLSHARRVSYVGSRSAGEMTRLLDDGFSAYSPIPARQPKRLLRPSADRVLFLDRDMVQSKFGLFAVDGEYDPSRAVGAQFYGSYMGGMDGVVFQQVREARSLAYYAYGGYRQAELRGEDSRASGYVECQADKTAEATALLKQLMSAMPVETKRFDEVKAGIEGLYRSDRVNFRAVPGKVMAWEDLGFAADPRPARFKTALLYTMPELTAFAQRFSKGPWTLFMMGSRPRVDMGALKRLGVLEDRAADQLFPY